MNTRTPHLILGLGNELFSDEGVGIEAGRRLARLDLENVEVVDGGTLGLALVPAIEGRETVLILDAALSADRRPGDVFVLGAEELAGAQRLFVSAHQVGILDALAAAELIGHRPARVAAVGMVPARLDTGYGLSPTALAALDEMVGRALDVLEEWGIREKNHA